MGVDTKGYVSKEVKAIDIYNVVQTKFDSEANFYIDEDRDGEIGNVVFKYNDDRRNLFYCVTSDKLPETEFDSKPHVALILGNWGESVRIMTEIVKEFGGYVDENDCDDIGPIYIGKDGKYAYSNYVNERNEIMSVLDEKLSHTLRIQIADQVIKHKEQLKQLL
ncbi:hypothetical protein F4V43_02280 [Paenibacillus spiritus]|uniref:Uncharacterized protein n=1 Tax=Paenibacillus spiritus TaxID=2496557 RepID=A0A5J5GHZ3_9BACL|nr:hypothetical protein [Paenibacillus spiritus]KAA9007333.1 hypothetical protein F4V43_02280 [Paenibacillus spiritus]